MIKKFGFPAIFLIVLALVMVTMSRADADRRNFLDTLVLIDSPADVPADATFVSSTKIHNCNTIKIWTKTVSGETTNYVYNDGVKCVKPAKPATDGKKALTSSTSQECLGGALVTKSTDTEGNITSSVVNGHEDCAQTDAKGEFIREEGM